MESNPYLSCQQRVRKSPLLLSPWQQPLTWAEAAFALWSRFDFYLVNAINVDKHIGWLRLEVIPGSVFHVCFGSLYWFSVPSELKSVTLCFGEMVWEASWHLEGWLLPCTDNGVFSSFLRRWCLQTHFLDQGGLALQAVLSILDHSSQLTFLWCPKKHWLGTDNRAQPLQEWAVIRLNEHPQTGRRPVICPQGQSPMEWPWPVPSSRDQAFLKGNLKPLLVWSCERLFREWRTSCRIGESICKLPIWQRPLKTQKTNIQSN